MKKVEVHIPHEIPDDLRQRICAEVRPVRLALASLLLESLHGLAQVNEPTVRAMIEAEKAVPQEETEKDRAFHAMLLSGLEAIADIMPRIEKWKERVTELGATLPKEEQAPASREEGEDPDACQCDDCKRQRAEGKEALRREAAMVGGSEGKASMSAGD